MVSDELLNTQQSEEEELYKENILDHYRHPHNKRELPHCTATYHQVNPVCGDEVTIYLIIEKGIITQVSFMGHGCAISQAATSMLTDVLKNIPLSKAQKITEQEVLSLLGIRISYARMNCALLSLKTIQGGLTQC